MNWTQKFMINEGLIIFAYAYMIRSYYAASVICAIVSVLLSVIWHSEKSISRHAGAIIISIVCQELVIYRSGLGLSYDLLPFLAICNAILTVVWMESSWKAIIPTVRITGASMMIMILAALVIPDSVLQRISSGLDQQNICLLTELIFMPLMCAALMKSFSRKTSHIRNIIIKCCVRDYDKLVSKTIH